MADIILHHYPTSPFSEKVRAILGYKQLAWKSVHQPTVMPKPDLTALTGGYRRAPVMQIGADVYCDSKLIVRALDRLYPAKPLVPDAVAASCAVYEQWTEQALFPLVVPILFQPQGIAHIFAKQPPAAIAYFQKDREALFATGNGRRPSAAATRAELPFLLRQIDAQLGAAPYLLGATPTLADFSVYHLIWFIHSNPGVAAYLDPYRHILAWVLRIAAFGHGGAEKLASEAAVQMARDSTPAEIGAAVAEATSLQPGAAASVCATDYGADPVTGVLVTATAEEVVLRRRDERAGEVLVHFPRAGFKLAAA